MGQLLHRLGGPPRQMLFPQRVGRGKRMKSNGQSHKKEEKEGGSGTGEGAQGPLGQERGRCLDICAGAPKSY